jgi:rhodanese-related sulfurtransferase
MQHSQQFLKLVNEARSRVRETDVASIQARIEAGDDFLLIDVREESEWEAGHIPGAIHLGKGIIERDIERVVPDPKEELVLYCGGGFRSVLAADNLNKMGYNAVSMDGGIRGWREAGLPMEMD